jgi:hypothetical protein
MVFANQLVAGSIVVERRILNRLLDWILGVVPHRIELLSEEPNPDSEKAREMQSNLIAQLIRRTLIANQVVEWTSPTDHKIRANIERLDDFFRSCLVDVQRLLDSDDWTRDGIRLLQSIQLWAEETLLALEN